jgi:hypothetical protein
MVAITLTQFYYFLNCNDILINKPATVVTVLEHKML